jgi:E3 ubiquitin-protein ligase MYCBP2
LELRANVHVVQVAAGSNHCVLRTHDGMVYTFGAHRQGQLGRQGDDRNWHSTPDTIEGFGQGQGTVAGWIGAAVDVTLVQSHKQVFSSETIADCQVRFSIDTVFLSSFFLNSFC